MLFDPEQLHATVPAAQVAALMGELAAALGADLASSLDTAGMMRSLAATDRLPIAPLPVVAGDA